MFSCESLKITENDDAENCVTIFLPISSDTKDISTPQQKKGEDSVGKRTPDDPRCYNLDFNGISLKVDGKYNVGARKPGHDITYCLPPSRPDSSSNCTAIQLSPKKLCVSQ